MHYFKPYTVRMTQITKIVVSIHQHRNPLQQGCHRVGTVAAIGNPQFVDGVQAPRLSVLLAAHHIAHIATHHNMESVKSRTLPSPPGTSPELPLFTPLQCNPHEVAAAVVAGWKQHQHQGTQQSSSKQQ